MDDWKVFYSWQSDLPNQLNRGFIQNALERAAKSISQDDSIKIEPVVDRDTDGVPGSPDIANTIFEKIDISQVFACDVSIINVKGEDKPTPNPNVLVELGYAYKAHKSERILMVMNTAFGKPELLPFDLSKKRVITYHLPPEVEVKSSVRKELVKKFEKALRTIISRMTDVPSRKKLSGQKTRHKEECENILDSGISREWQALIDELWRDIPKRMLEWKPKAEATWDHDSGELDPRRLEAVEICLPCIVPILVTIERGREDFWELAINSLRRLALLRNQFGGGVAAAIEIGGHMLYIAGSLGMALATDTKQLNFVNKWMHLPMPPISYRDNAEQTWASTYFAHHLWGRYIPGNREPFADILKICESDYLSTFFPDKSNLIKNLFLANLSQSLFEMGRCVEDDECLKSLEAIDENRFKSQLNVWPVWALMDTNEFKSSTWELFGSSKELLEFVFGGGMSLEKLWGWWKKWKKICCHNIMEVELSGRPIRMVRAEFLMLPGEPI
jgi:hypothetical protein